MSHQNVKENSQHVFQHAWCFSPFRAIQQQEDRNNQCHFPLKENQSRSTLKKMSVNRTQFGPLKTFNRNNNWSSDKSTRQRIRAKSITIFDWIPQGEYNHYFLEMTTIVLEKRCRLTVQTLYDIRGNRLTTIKASYIFVCRTVGWQPSLCSGWITVWFSLYLAILWNLPWRSESHE